MGFNGFINEIIEKNFSKIERRGERIRLRTVIRLRVLYTIVCGIIFVILNFLENFSAAFYVMLIYFVLMYRANNVNIIRLLARKNPKMPILKIIEGDMKP